MDIKLLIKKRCKKNKTLNNVKHINRLRDVGTSCKSLQLRANLTSANIANE